MRVAGALLLTAVLFSLTPALAELPDQQASGCQEASEFKCCGDIQLVFRNPDLNPTGGNPVRAGGSLFGQFQAIGADADDIVFFGFSFSATDQELSEEQVCGQEPWAPSGAYVINYRADTNAEDGFFINLQTDLVPDGAYLAAVHGYDANDNEIARAWTKAVVDNCDPATNPPRCEGDTEQHIRQDKTLPWPIMLPGDGVLTPSAIGAPDEATLTLEFAEELSELRVYVDGMLIHNKNGSPSNMTSYEGRQWDDDLLPGYGPNGLGGELVPECSQQPPQTCGTLGEAWYYTGPISDDNIVRVEAVDMAGNLAKKEIHIGSGVGGAITDTAPQLTFTAEILESSVAPGETAVFPVSFQNTGGTTAHPFASAEAPDGWTVEWTPAHTPTPPSQTSKQELNVRVPADATPAIYQVNATIEYDAGGGETKSQEWAFKVLVGGAQPGDVATTGGSDDEDGDGGAGKDSPGVGAVLPLLFVAVAVALRRR